MIRKKLKDSFGEYVERFKWFSQFSQSEIEKMCPVIYKKIWDKHLLEVSLSTLTFADVGTHSFSKVRQCQYCRVLTQSDVMSEDHFASRVFNSV